MPFSTHATAMFFLDVFMYVNLYVCIIVFMYVCDLTHADFTHTYSNSTTEYPYLIHDRFRYLEWNSA